MNHRDNSEHHERPSFGEGIHNPLSSMNQKILPKLNVQKLIEMDAVFVINHSGGKDSQAMTAYLKALIPSHQLVVIHAHLPEVDWSGINEHILNTIGEIPYYEVQAVKTFFQMVEHRKMFPDAKNRQCTSDLKRGPIDKKIREISRISGKKLIINCMGIRAEESTSRAKKHPFTMNKSQSIAGRKWYNWYPIFNEKIQWVWDTIKNANQTPHWAYLKGMTRLSCCFCILASEHDLKTAAYLNPELLDRIDEIERRLDFTLIMPSKNKPKRFLKDIVSRKKTIQTSLAL
jgi:3'-phosphoadenosine 5'-phosphosulfate sulfotransferase (PAPS reductase)/FAD synthetase